MCLFPGTCEDIPLNRDSETGLKNLCNAGCLRLLDCSVFNLYHDCNLMLACP